MAIKKYKPTSPGRRGMTGDTFEDISRERPERSLTVNLKQQAGRNAQGRVTVRHRGGGAKRRYRLIDFKRDKHNVQARVATIEYDPNRSARIALLHYVDGEKRYIVAPDGLRIGDTLRSGRGIEARVGNCMPLSEIPLGTLVHNVELKPGDGAQLARSAGGYAQVLAKDAGYVTLRLPSGETRKVLETCFAVIGQASNLDHANIKLGKAGRKRHLGIRPTVRGTAMSPRDHPHGGGEGRSPVGMSGPKSPWGKPTRGKRTRVNKRTDRLIVRRRVTKRR